MLRSLLLPRLRRHGCRSVSWLGRRASWITSRGYYITSEEDETDFEDVDHPDAKPDDQYYYGCTSLSNTRRHLYLVLDDWSKGFSIYKLDLDDHHDGRGDLSLPAPVHRQEKKHSTGRPWNFATLGGSKIVAAGALDPRDEAATLMYDTETAGLSVVPRLPEVLRGPWTLAAAAGKGLNVFAAGSKMHRLDEPVYGVRQHWTWDTIPSPLPFRVRDIESSALHPEGPGRMLFVSVGRSGWKKYTSSISDDSKDEHPSDSDGTVGLTRSYEEGSSHTRTPETFSYMRSGKWRRHGEWDLPFHGQGHYDGELEAWVGLHKIFHHSQQLTDGYLSSCDVAAPDGCPVQPAWKLCAERLFDPDDDWHIGASLVYMGDNTYCLAELVAHERFKKRRRLCGGHKCAARLAIFRLKYGKKGELTITARRPDQTYLFPRFGNNTEVRAFWM